MIAVPLTTSAVYFTPSTTTLTIPLASAGKVTLTTAVSPTSIGLISTLNGAGSTLATLNEVVFSLSA